MLTGDFLLNAQPALAATSPTGCTDDALWENHSGRKCDDYSREGWCKAGALEIKWTGGAQFNFPERACCACGKAALLAAAAAATAAKLVPTAPAPTPAAVVAAPAPTSSAFTPTTGGGAPA